MKKQLLFLFICFIALKGFSQNAYRYFVDLNKVTDDRLTVELITPKTNKKSIDFLFAKIIPGTYRNADYGQFIYDLKAFDNKGNLLSVARKDTNTWTIKNADKLYKITYQAEDTWDTKTKNNVYTMAGTNIEEGKNFVINTPGFFGYFEEMRNLPFTLEFNKPENFYATTSMSPEKSTSTADRFTAGGLDQLYDSPIMFNLPDTTTVHVGGTDVLISVYSPKRKMRSAMVAQALTQNLRASAKYLGGSLPVKHYTFIMYFNGEQSPAIAQGALEHNYSSFYTLPEAAPQQIMKYVLDVTGHEFFHVLTPLNFSSKEIKQFNFQKPVLSKHLWLYEGSTEYASDHVQVKYGLNTVQEFFDKLSEKISKSKRFNDTLPFTVMSKEVATTYKDQYDNVYEKGSLIATCLDLELLKLSAGTYGIQRLKYDLSVLYGKDKYFADDELFDVITKLTYPEIREFFRKYVEGNRPLPYADFFSLAGVNYTAEKRTEELTLGGFMPVLSPDGKIIIGDVSKRDDFGRKLGFNLNDQILAMNGIAVSPQNFGPVLNNVRSKMKAGDAFSMTVLRGTDTLRLSGILAPSVIVRKDVLEFQPNATEQQVAIRNAWLSTPDRPVSPPADPADVKDIDAIVTSLYKSLSGRAGSRNWDRFRSLFSPSALMSAGHNLPNGQIAFTAFSFEDYIQMNGPFLAKTDFFEEEIGRKTDQFGSMGTVRSAYQFKFSESGKIEQRGVNVISLIKEKGRWFISNITWQDETPTTPIPTDLLNK